MSAIFGDLLRKKLRLKKNKQLPPELEPGTYLEKQLEFLSRTLYHDVMKDAAKEIWKAVLQVC